MDQTLLPTEVRLRADKRHLSIAFPQAEIYELPAELLRVESPSAEVRGHGNAAKKIVGGKQDVTIAALEPAGHYALKIVFSDGHDSGFYTWTFLRELGQTQDEVWQTYLARLKEEGLRRDVD